MSSAPPKLGTLFGYKAISRSQSLSGTDKSVASSILDHYNHKTGRCDPSRETLAALVGTNVRSVSRSITKIAKSGLFTVIRHGGVQQCNFYKPNWAQFEQIESEWQQRRKTYSMRFTDQNLSPQQGQSCHLPPDENVMQTSSTNLLLLTHEPKFQSHSERGFAKGSGLAARPSSPNQAQVAVNKAEARWNKDLIKKYGAQSPTYAKVTELLTSDMQQKATDAELKRRGGGIDWIQKALLEEKLIAP